MRLVRYDLIGASYAGENHHPQTVIRRWCPDAFALVPQSVADCWTFNITEPLPVNAPDYFVDIGDRASVP